jgi:hypothetical protein
MRFARLAPLLVLFFALPARAADDVQKRLDDARKETQRLQSELNQKKSEAQGLFTQVTAAENAAGLAAVPCTVMETGPMQTPPPPGAVYAKLHVRRAAFQMTIAFPDAKPKTQNGFRLWSGACTAGKQ